MKKKERPTCRIIIMGCECCKSKSSFFMTNREIFAYLY